ncbi:MAG: energy-coupling factor ABC transporter ATP-binding protein [Methanomicrobiales archaeon]
MIELSSIRHGILNIPSLLILPGSTVIIGPNGSGKTTLLQIIAGITSPQQGTIIIDGKSPTSVNTGWLNEYPDRNLLFGTVSDEIASPLRFRHDPCAEVRDQVNSVAQDSGTSHLLGRRTRDLSGGEKVLVSLATAMVTRPLVLVLDESDSHLDQESTNTLTRLIRSSKAPYNVWCTQDMEAAAGADRVILLEGGVVTRSGTPFEVFSELSGDCLYPLSWRLSHAPDV